MVIQYAFYGTNTIFADFDLLYCYYAHYEQFSNNSAKKKDILPKLILWNTQKW